MQITNTPLEAEIERMYWDGATDCKIAKSIGCATSTICAWRGRKDYMANDIQGRKPWKRYRIKSRKTGDILADGSVAECAEQMGKSVSAIRDIVTKTKRGLLGKYIVEVYEVYGQ